MKTKRFYTTHVKNQKGQPILNTDRDRKNFFEALDQIPEPNPALKELLSR